MKAVLLVLLAISMALNVTFTALLLRDRFASAESIQNPAANPAAVAAAPEAQPAQWSALQPGRLPDLASRLEAEGFPPALVEAILAAEISESMAARRKALSDQDDGPFWRERLRDPKIQMAYRQIMREERQRLREVLGRDPDESPTAALYRHKDLGFLPPEKGAELRTLLRDFDERRADLYSAGYSAITDAETIRGVDKEQEAALAALLTPAELLEYNLRHSRTAQSMREDLSAFGATEQEFRAIYSLRASFDERFSGPGVILTISGDERFRAQRAMNDQIKAMLGPERGAEYEKKTDYNYRRTSQLVGRLQLPPETTDQLFAIQKEVEQQRREFFTQRPSAAEMTEKMTALQKETIARVAPLLGERGLAAYHQYGGSWLQSLVPRPRPPPAPAR